MAISYTEDMHSNAVTDITWNELYEADRTFPVPFKLTLKDHEEPVYCEQLVRIIPGKRMVLFGTWDNQPVVIKVFYEKGRASYHVKRELEGVDALLNANIPTPNLLFHGPAANKHVQVLLFERIFDAKSLDEIWQARNDNPDILELLSNVVVELATQHVLGITQQDLHFKNFLIKDEKIYTLDGASIQVSETILDKKESLNHLALFFSQLGVGAEKLQKELFRKYTSSRGWILKKADIRFFNTTMKKWYQQRWQNYERKLFRNCTPFARLNKVSAVIMYDRQYCSDEFFHLLIHPETIFTDPQTEDLKNGRSSTVVKVMINDKAFVVKRYNIKSVWHWLRRCLRATRAARSWRLAQLFRLFGIPTAKSVAFIENRFLGLRGTSYFIMEYVEGKNIGEYFADYQASDERFEKVAERTSVLLNNLAKLRVSHGDLKMTNILIHHEQPILLDLDGVIEHRSKNDTRRGYSSEVQRFMQNWQMFPAVRNLFARYLAQS